MGNEKWRMIYEPKVHKSILGYLSISSYVNGGYNEKENF